MKYFKCITQESGMQSFRGVSGKGYASIQGHSFPVQDEMDIAYFREKRQFEEIGAIKRMISKPVKVDKAKDFSKWLDNVKGLNKKTKSLIADSYEILDNLDDHTQNGGKLPQEITKKQKELLLDALNVDKDLRG